MEPMQRTVLVAEDEPLIRLVLTSALEDEGYTVFEASNALEAVAIFAWSPCIDAVITDVNMPGALNGFDLVELVAAGGKPMAKIVTSGLHSASDHALPSGCRFLSKPYRLGEVISELETQLAKLNTLSPPSAAI